MKNVHEGIFDFFKRIKLGSEYVKKIDGIKKLSGGNKKNKLYKDLKDDVTQQFFSVRRTDPTKAKEYQAILQHLQSDKVKKELGLIEHKIKLSELRQIIKEEIHKLNESKIKTFADFTKHKESKIKNIYVNDADEDYMDVDAGVGIDLTNADDDDFSDMKKAEKLWDVMFIKVDKVSIKGKLLNGTSYEIYSSFDSSGLSYWIRQQEYFNVRTSIRIKTPATFELTPQDENKLVSDIDKQVKLIFKIIQSGIKSLNAINDGEEILIDNI